MTGVVFDIREFTVHDGPGIRVTVFLKGCPLHCRWCHNPEGLSPRPQLMKKVSLCVHCGLCERGCGHAECQPFGVCLHACPKGLLSVSGEVWEAEELAEKLQSYAPVLPSGGITFSGGEPLLQGEFVIEVCRRLTLHKALQTSGYADAELFRRVLQEMDFVLFDLKLADGEKHREYTGQDNALILQNYRILLESGRPHVVRVPLIPGITDTDDNLRAIAALAGRSHVELMRYNPLAGAKYPMVGMTYPLSPPPPREVDLKLFRSASYV